MSGHVHHQSHQHIPTVRKVSFDRKTCLYTHEFRDMIIELPQRLRGITAEIWPKLAEDGQIERPHRGAPLANLRAESDRGVKCSEAILSLGNQLQAEEHFLHNTYNSAFRIIWKVILRLCLVGTQIEASSSVGFVLNLSGPEDQR